MIYESLSTVERAGPVLNYIFSGDKEAHDHDIEHATIVASNKVMAYDPISRCPKTGKAISFNLRPLIGQFEQESKRYKGRSGRLFTHHTVAFAPGESPSREQLSEVTHAVMRSLGYNDSAYIAVLHTNSQNTAPHIHILACRAVDKPNGKVGLVSDSKNYAKGRAPLKDLAEKYGFVSPPAPEDSPFPSLSKREIEVARKTGKVPWKMEVGTRVISALEQSKGKSYTHFIMSCEALGISVKTRLSSEDKPVGVSFLYKGKEISGRKLKSTRLTYPKITTIGEITYEPTQDLYSIKAANEKIDATGQRQAGSPRVPQPIDAFSTYSKHTVKCRTTEVARKKIQDQDLIAYTEYELEDGDWVMEFTFYVKFPRKPKPLELTSPKDTTRINYLLELCLLVIMFILALLFGGTWVTHAQTLELRVEEPDVNLDPQIPLVSPPKLGAGNILKATTDWIEAIAIAQGINPNQKQITYLAAEQLIGRVKNRSDFVSQIAALTGDEVGDVLRKLKVRNAMSKQIRRSLSIGIER